MESRRVLPDVNVCFPISLLDLVLRLDEAELHRAIWTDYLLDELARVWVERGARSADAAAKVCRDVRQAFGEQVVERGDYEKLICLMPGSDPDDRPHAAAAVARAPSIVLTNNIKDFPPQPLRRLGVEVRRPDDYLVGLFDENPDEFAAAARVRRLAL